MADQSTPTIQQKGGNVGISTASPKSRLDLSPPASQSTVSTLGYSANAQLNIRIPNSVGDVGQIVFTNDAAPTAGYASIGVVMTSGAGVGLGDIIMSTKSVGGDAVSSERLRITSAGYVGIGTSAPTRTLDVRSDVGVLIKGASSSTDATLSLVPASGGRQYDFRNYGSSFGIKDASADVIRMYFHYNGNTGIGTSNPINAGTTIETTGAAFSTTATKNSNMYGLTLVSTTNENTMSGVWFGSGGGSHWSGIAGSRSNYTVDWSTHLSFYTHIANTVNITDATEKMRITGDGNVGIGTTSPTYNLTVVGSTSGAAVAGFQNTSSTGYSGAHILNNSGTLMGHFGYGNASISGGLSDLVYFGSIASKAVVFTTTDTEKMRITSGGNIGIATSSPSVLLHLENNGSSYSAPSSNNFPCIYLNNTNSSSSTAHALLVLRTLGGNGGNPFISFDINGVQGWAMGIDNADGDKFKLNYGWSSLNSATRLTFETGGNATFSANVTASAFFESSDLRLKSNIYTYTPNSILDVVAKVYEKNGRVEVGYIAQDLKGVLDSAISEREDGYLDLSYRQVHTAKIAALEKEIAELKKQLKQK